MGVVPAVMIVAGGAGNLIDRIVLGYVTDMFNTLFMTFAVFNVADICITVGGVLLVIYVVFFYEKFEKKGGGANAH
jgi:signal peptidase II